MIYYLNLYMSKKVFFLACYRLCWKVIQNLDMERKMHIKIKSVLLIILLLALVESIQYIYHAYQTKMYRTKEPLLISYREIEGNPFYVLPPGTVLYLDEVMPEGFCRFMIYANFKGIPNSEEIPMKLEWGGNYIAPVWLDKITKDELKEMMQHFPLSKGDVLEIIKSNELTRDDLEDIIQQLPENQ